MKGFFFLNKRTNVKGNPVVARRQQWDVTHNFLDMSAHLKMVASTSRLAAPPSLAPEEAGHPFLQPGDWGAYDWIGTTGHETPMPNQISSLPLNNITRERIPSVILAV